MPLVAPPPPNPTIYLVSFDASLPQREGQGGRGGESTGGGVALSDFGHCRRSRTFKADRTCTCTDRKLLPIAKKGRPVSQCNHCRSMRKSRSAHVKCDCGERIAALKEAAKNGIRPAPLSTVGGENKVGCVGGAIGGAIVGGGGSHKGVAVAAAPLGVDSKSELAWLPG